MPLQQTAQQSLLRERDGAIERWTLNLPDQRNLITPEMIDAIEAAAGTVNRDPDIRAVVLTGAGTAFCSGGNIKDMYARAGMFAGSPAQLRQGYRHGIQRITSAVYDCEVPVIAAVNGAAIGAGCDLALMCDIRVASSRAVFAESFVKIGLVAGDGGSWLLPRAIGAARAAEMAYTGDTIDANTALNWGLVSRVVAPNDLLDTAAELAARIAANPPHAVRMTKRLLAGSAAQTLDAHLEFAAALQPLAHHTHDHHEALCAMLEHREPNITGH